MDTIPGAVLFALTLGAIYLAGWWHGRRDGIKEATAWRARLRSRFTRASR